MIENKLIELLRYAKIEHLYVFKDEKQILHFKGNENSVEVPNQFLIRFKNSTILHNHTQGTSFSESDVVEAIENDVSKFILITADFKYTLTRPQSGWNIDFKNPEVLFFYENCKNFAKSAIENSKMKNELRYDEENLYFNHYIWLLFFTKYEISYEKKAIS